MQLHETKNDIAKETREKVINLLNQSLADALDLKSQAKPTHWNVKGPSFIALHELFDQVAAEMDTHVDDLAERATTLGGVAMGTVRLASERSSLAEYPHEISDVQWLIVRVVGLILLVWIAAKFIIPAQIKPHLVSRREDIQTAADQVEATMLETSQMRDDYRQRLEKIERGGQLARH